MFIYKLPRLRKHIKQFFKIKHKNAQIYTQINTEVVIYSELIEKG
jgi:hypothetical protein